MDRVSTGKFDARSVNWAHPMNNSTHLPLKSPHGYSMFSSSSLFDNGGGLNFLPSQPSSRGTGEHRLSPSTGYVPQEPPASWLSDRLGSPEGVVVLKKCSYRRSSSDSVAFVDNSNQYINYLENVTEEDEFTLQDEPPLPPSRRGLSADYDSFDQSLQYTLPARHSTYSEKSTRGDHDVNRLDREQFSRVRGNEPLQRHQPRHESLAAYNRVGGSNVAKSGFPEDIRNSGKAKKHVTLTIPSCSRGDSPLASRGRAHNWSSSPSFENRSTASDSNSHSDDSNDDNIRGKSYERFRSDSEVRSEEGGDGPAPSHDADQVDPKKAKRILANRQSAQRSRVRKLQYISELERNVNVLETELASLSPKVGCYDQERVLLSAENALLKQKLAALSKSQRLKEAHNETLKTEVQRLRQIYNQQQKSNLQRAQQQRPPDATLDLQLLRLSQLDLGPMPAPKPAPKPKSPNGYTSAGVRSSSGRPSLYPSYKVISPSHSQINSSSSNIISRPLKGVLVPPSCMGGRMMGGANTSFMVQNS